MYPLLWGSSAFPSSSSAAGLYLSTTQLVPYSSRKPTDEGVRCSSPILNSLHTSALPEPAAYFEDAAHRELRDFHASQWDAYGDPGSDERAQSEEET
jgi:hypothetical protein